MHFESTKQVVGKMRACREADRAVDRKVCGGGGGCTPFPGEVGPYLTVLPGPRHTSIPSGILIHQVIWP